MRSLFLVLLIANLLLFAAGFVDVRKLIGDAPEIVPAPLNAELLRIVRDTSVRPRGPATTTSGNPTAPNPDENAQPINGTNNR